MGLITNESIKNKEFVTDFPGDLIDQNEAFRREKLYDQNPGRYGSFMFFFIHRGKKMWYETKDSGRKKQLFHFVNFFSVWMQQEERSNLVISSIIARKTST